MPVLPRHKMPGARRHKPHPEGDRKEMTAEWKERVRSALRDRGVGEQWLADQIAARRGMRVMKRDTVNKMLRIQHTSALVPDVCAILGLEPPMTATPLVTDEETREAIELLLRATPEVRRSVLVLLQQRFKSG